MNFSFKTRFLVSLLSSTMGTTFLLSPTYAMDPPCIEETKITSVLKTKKKFKTMAEAMSYAKNLYTLALQKKFTEVLNEELIEKILPETRINMQKAIYNHALSESHTNMGHNSLKTSEAISHYKKSVDYVNAYLCDSDCGTLYVDPIEKTNVLLNGQRAIMQDRAAGTLLSWAFLLMKPGEDEDAIRATESMLSLESSNARLTKKAIQGLSPKDRLAKSILSSASLSREQAIYFIKLTKNPPNSMQKSLIMDIIALIKYCDSETKKKLHKNIRQILHELRPDPEYQQIKSNVSSFLEQQQELDVSLAKKNKVPTNCKDSSVEQLAEGNRDF